MKPTEKELECILFAKRYLRSDINILLHESKEEIAQNITFDVSEKKTFEQLWGDHGLRDYGINHMHRGIFNDESKRECIKYWVEVLYPVKIDTDEIEKDLVARAVERWKRYYQEHPNGHIRIASSIDNLPYELGKRYGDYCDAIDSSS
jgi:hypothetical protein